MPSPQATSYLLALPIGVIDNVTVVPAPPSNGDPEKLTALTKVFVRTLSTISFKSSMALVTKVLLVHPVYAPSAILPSVGVPNGITLPFCEAPPTCAATDALVDKACAVTGSAPTYYVVAPINILAGGNF